MSTIHKTPRKAIKAIKRSDNHHHHKQPQHTTRSKQSSPNFKLKHRSHTRGLHSTPKAFSSTIPSPPNQTTFPTAKLALIDISPFIDSTTKTVISPLTLTNSLTPQQQQTVDELTTALNQQGFFFITGAPLQPLVPKLQSISTQFFALPPGIKHQSHAIDTRRGWHQFQAAPGTTSENNDAIEAWTMQTPYHTDRQLGAQYFGYSDDEGDGNGTGIGGAPPGIFIDPKLLAMINNDQSASSTFTTSTPTPSHHPPSQTDTNKWPRLRSSLSTQGEFDHDCFQSIYKEVWDQSVSTSEAVLVILALSLRINPLELLEWHSLGNHTLESKYYPSPNDSIVLPKGGNLVDGRSPLKPSSQSQPSQQPPQNLNDSLNNVRIRFPIHSDMTSITLLTQTQQNGGLMIKTRSRGWERVGLPDNYPTDSSTPPPILVNIGQFLAEFSAGSLDASLHCVVNSNDLEPSPSLSSASPAQSRISTVFFCIPDHHAIIRDIRDPSRPYYGQVFNQASNVTLPQPDLEPFYSFEAGDRFPVVGM